MLNLPSIDGKKVSLLRARHETVNLRLKRFNILSSRFRHKLELHGICFHAVPQIVQTALVCDEPLFSS